MLRMRAPANARIPRGTHASAPAEPACTSFGTAARSALRTAARSIPRRLPSTGFPGADFLIPPFSANLASGPPGRGFRITPDAVPETGGEAAISDRTPDRRRRSTLPSPGTRGVDIRRATRLHCGPTRRIETCAPLFAPASTRRTKEEAAAVLDAIGLTVSDAFRLMMVRIAAEKRLPFEPLVPNADTIAAMKAARQGDLVTVGDVDGLMADLRADD